MRPAHLTALVASLGVLLVVALIAFPPWTCMTRSSGAWRPTSSVPAAWMGTPPTAGPGGLCIIDGARLRRRVAVGLAVAFVAPLVTALIAERAASRFRPVS